MNEFQWDKAVKLGDLFSIEFSKLCGKYISQMSKECEAELTMYLGDKTSIYGSNYSVYIKRKKNEVRCKTRRV